MPPILAVASGAGAAAVGVGAAADAAGGGGAAAGTAAVASDVATASLFKSFDAGRFLAAIRFGCGASFHRC